MIQRAKISIHPFKKVLKTHKIFTILSLVFTFYILLHIPLSFLYPNHNEPIRKNIEPEYFMELTYDLEGDCYRVSRSFIRECPFNVREVHLSSAHTIVEIQINGKWHAYDPLFKIFFNHQNAAQLSFDVRRGYIPEEMEDYPYIEEFKEIYYYHHWYFVMLKYLNPYYNRIVLKMYSYF